MLIYANQNVRTSNSLDSTSQVQKLHFLLPAYNEEASILDLIDRISVVCEESQFEYDILVVDDGSKDKTAEIVRQKSESLPIVLLQNKPNKGLGFTIRKGLKFTSENANDQDLIITLDADLTQDPAYITKMVDKINGGADVVIASRYRKGSGTEGLSFYRHCLSIGASIFMMILHPIRGVRDYSCGFRMYKVSTIKKGFSTYGNRFITENGFACMVEIAARLRNNTHFEEIPFVLKYDYKRKPSEMKILTTIKAYLRVISRVKSDSSKKF